MQDDQIDPADVLAPADMTTYLDYPFHNYQKT
jgi:hypothetical protein